MTFNPFKEKPRKMDETIMSWNDMYVKSYDKNEVSPYTKTRCILANGTEYEATWCKHHFNRHYPDNEARRQVALLRRNEQQQQKMISLLKPIDESLLETTIAYEQLAVDLTAFLAQRADDANVKMALDFALLEDFDHLYRYANMLEADMTLKMCEIYDYPVYEHRGVMIDLARGVMDINVLKKDLIICAKANLGTNYSFGK